MRDRLHHRTDLRYCGVHVEGGAGQHAPQVGSGTARRAAARIGSRAAEVDSGQHGYESTERTDRFPAVVVLLS
ncbi:hypothetical protein GCM10020369_41790 [Cryptosporangium minutisporangium]|uniref:Uncharacterized protein n=1 Tax=Cryptosporangium minutisporangium TaxID=113569 RepID=A0ABP6T2H6_9ACTN